MPASPLTLPEREQILVGIERQQNDTTIALPLGRHPATISREITANGGRSRYRAHAAHDRAAQSRKRPKVPKIVADSALADVVARRLQAGDSPMTISIELARGIHGHVKKISHETIYHSIHHDGFGLPRGLHRCLHLRRRNRKPRHRKATNTNSLGTFNTIHSRPIVAWMRTEVGHLEGDLIVGKHNQSALITIFDRASRWVWLANVKNKTADALDRALIRAFRRIPVEFRRTLTWDQGAEIAHHQHIAAICGIDIYIADPKSPWQRPTNENGNALIRRYVGKSTDLNLYTSNDLRRIEQRINTIPRRSLNWATAQDIYTANLAMTT